MDNPVFRSACLGAGIALLLTLVITVFTAGGSPAPQAAAPSATAMEAPSPTLGPTVQEPSKPAPAAP